MQAAMRVLVVDDCRDAADSLSLLLGLLDCQVSVAYDAPGALRKAAAFKPQVIFLDLGLPQMDGFKVARHLRAMPALAGCLLVAYTGYSNYEEQAMLIGFHDYLLKPVSIERLRGVLNRARKTSTGENKVATGKIKKIVLDKGFGFIQAANGKDIFFHHSSVANQAFEDLSEGRQVEFEIDDGKGDKGPRAKSVMPL